MANAVAGPSNPHPNHATAAKVDNIQQAVNNVAPSLSSEQTNALWKLGKTAELKKHTTELQLQTAYIIAAQHSLDVRNSALQDVREQKNWLESERLSLMKQLELVNDDNNRAMALEARMQRECDDLSAQVRKLTDGEYAAAKAQVDTLRAELQMPPTRSLQAIFDEKYLEERRLAAPKPIADAAQAVPLRSVTSTRRGTISTSAPPNASAPPPPLVGIKRPAPGDSPQDDGSDDVNHGPTKKRGRPKGSKNKKTSKD
ncbi:hypothetical protein DL93DRAFT_2166939 [Clavulina sp. PMI_390]|nr:hypothetical protein DL93DRAFT_2166939 [Clavulina sp. PMI_390]